MKENGASERHQNNNLKAVLSFAIYLDYKLLEQVDKKEDVITFLQIHDIVNPLDFLNLVMNTLMRYSIGNSFHINSGWMNLFPSITVT